MSASLTRVTLEVASRDAECASALLSALSGAPAAGEQREGKSVTSVSVYVPRATAIATMRRLPSVLKDSIRTGALQHARTQIAKIDGRAWSTDWRKFFAPHLLAPGLYVVPSWRREFKAPRRAGAIVIDPGMAFGTGLHATTRLAATLLSERVRPKDIVIDVGCGSGILGLAAARRGARVYLCDEDADAVRIARKNFSTNRMRARRIVRAERIPASFPKANIVVANIDGPALSALASNIYAALTRGGIAIASGIDARGRLEVLAQFARAGLRFVSEHKRGAWFAYVHVRP